MNLVASVFIQTFGFLAGLGLLLNLCGYGYRISAERGIEVGTLTEMRRASTEQRFLREFSKSVDIDAR